MMTPHRFRELGGAGYNRVPLAREVEADLETPLSAYMKLADGPYSCLLESVQGGERWGRYSLIGLPAGEVLEARGDQVTVRRAGRVIEQLQNPDPLRFVEEFRGRYRVPNLPGLPRFHGGLAGYFGFECLRYMEPRLAGPYSPDPLGCPDLLLMLLEEMVVFDNLRGNLWLVVHADPAVKGAYENAMERLAVLEERLSETLPEERRARPGAPPADAAAVAPPPRSCSFPRPRYEAAVTRVKRYIVDGDVMQVVLSQRMAQPFDQDPLDLYRALRHLNPSPYMYYLNLDDFSVVGSSPEVLVRLEGDTVTLRPIAGTRPRGGGDAEDTLLEEEMLNDPKERAEHLMLIDLGRNDVGRVAVTGSVQVTECMTVERYSHVMHIVSNVTGRLADGAGPLDVLRACFPAGTVSGAPKIRALEIIRELEPERRGIYAGAVGYISWHGDLDTAIAIRTALLRDGTLYVQAGGGLVADSVAEREWQETLNKGNVLFHAAALAEARAARRAPPTPRAADA